MKRIATNLSGLLTAALFAIALVGCPGNPSEPSRDVPLLFSEFAASIECGEVPFTVEFTSEAYTITGTEIVEWEWGVSSDTEGNSGVEGTGPTFFFTFDRPGNYTVFHGVTDEEDFTSETERLNIRANSEEGQCGGGEFDVPNSNFGQVYPVFGQQIATGNLVLIEPDSEPGAELERFLLTGSGPGQAGSSDMYVVKTDWNGNELWSRTIGGDGIEQCYGAASTGDGGGLLVGESEVTTGNREQFAVRLDTNGIQMWSKVWPGPGALDTIRAVTAAGPDRFFLVGEIGRVEGELETDFTFVTINGDGDDLISTTLSRSANAFPRSVEWTQDGGYVIVGLIGELGVTQPYLVKIDSNHNMVYERFFEGTGIETPRDIAEAANGDLIITGSAGDFFDSDLFIIRMDSEGEILWQQTFVDDGDTGGYGVSARTNGDIAVIATTSEQNSRYVYDMLLVVTDADGEEQLRRRKGDEGSSTTTDRGADILESPRDGSFLMFGHSNSFGDSNDFIFVKANETFATSEFDIPPQIK